jgi:hypothetical protein
MSEDRITLDPPKPPQAERPKADPTFVSAARSAFGTKPAPLQAAPRPAVKRDEGLRLTPPPGPREERQEEGLRLSPPPGPRAEEREPEEDSGPDQPREVVPKRKPMPVRAPVAASQEQNRERARRVARMKFSFYKLAAGLFFVNILFFTVSYLEVPPGERFWWIWPAAASLLVLFGGYIRAFMLKGRSIQAYIDSFLTRIEEREVTRELDRM